MSELLNVSDLMDSWNHPPTRHAMVVHLPIGLSMIGAALALFAAILHKNLTLRVIAIAVFAGLLVTTLIAVNSGELAEHDIPVMTDTVNELVHDHEAMGDGVKFFAIGAFILLCFSAVKRPVVRIAAHWLAAIVACGGVLWVGRTAHLGGQLVYIHGVGAPGSGPGSGPGSAPAPVSATGSEQRSIAETQSAPSTQSFTLDDSRLTFFRTEIAPILETHCVRCHNPSKARRAGHFDQTTPESIMRGGRSGTLIVPGEPDNSLFIKRVRGDIPAEDIMPPEGKLPDDVIAKLEQWVREGAVWAGGGLQVPTEDE